jgi:hypothetical protein|tara:strand:+ start:1991 stop:2167 length:177 start_codon:yes stop_codon:yes gene_type:complete
MNNLEYLDIKRVIETTKQEIENAGKASEINKIVLEAMNKELKKHPVPQITEEDLPGKE